jgi:hypothetical protein
VRVPHVYSIAFGAGYKAVKSCNLPFPPLLPHPHISASFTSFDEGTDHIMTSMLGNASNFSMGQLRHKHIQGDYIDQRLLTTIHDNSVRNSTVYYQEGNRGSIVNGNIMGDVNTYAGGIVIYTGGDPGSFSSKSRLRPKRSA